MKTILVLLGILFVLAVVAIPAVKTDLKALSTDKDWANIHLMPDDLEQAILDLHPKQVLTVHHDKFALAKHSWSEPDSVAHDIAQRNQINLLDQPIGTVVEF